MSERDAFDDARADAEARRRELDTLRRDVEALVRDEVRRAGIPEGRLRAMVTTMTREAMAGERAGDAAGPRWRSGPALLAAGVVAGVALGAAGWAAWTGWRSGEPDAAVRAATAAEAVASPSEAAAPVPDAPSAAERAALFDSLWAARSDRFLPLLARLEAAGPAPVVAGAVVRWRDSTPLDANAEGRLHDALVQLALNEAAGAGLALDGIVSRGPCRGRSCGALVELWRTGGEALGLPAPPADSGGVEARLPVVERVLVLSRLEGS